MHGNNVSFFSFKCQVVHVMFSHWIIMPRLVLCLRRHFRPVHLVSCVPGFSTGQGCICIGSRLLFFPQAGAQTLNSPNNTGQLNTFVCSQNPLGYLALFHVTKEPNIPTINSTGLTLQVWFSFFVWVKFHHSIIPCRQTDTIWHNSIKWFSRLRGPTSQFSKQNAPKIIQHDATLHYAIQLFGVVKFLKIMDLFSTTSSTFVRINFKSHST